MENLMNTGKIAAMLLEHACWPLRAWALPNPVNEPLPLVGTADHGHTYPGATVPFRHGAT
jgi:putative alpha-1,2-mannosidase